MAIIRVQKGTKDILPSEMPVWHFMEEKAAEVFAKYGAKEIRTPIFEATELFARGVGDTTDIVNKEMYTFEKYECSNEVKGSWDNKKWKFTPDLTADSTCKLYFIKN